MTETGPQRSATANTITGGVFFSAVIQGRDIQVVLPTQVRPALTGLPPASRVFTGRNDSLTTLQQTLRPDAGGGAQLVSAVAGLAGIGKTELVLHTAHQALDAGWFPGGVLFVDLFGYDPQRRLSAADALAGWLSAIGIPGEHIPAGEQDRSRLWRSVLDTYTSQGRRLLLIIDNAAGEDQVLPLLPGDTRTPVLVTSRHTLDLDARLHDLDILDTAAAIALIRQVVAGRRGDSDPRLQPAQHTALTDLAARCAGLALALRIVAALLADRPQLQPAVLAARLADEQTRLDGLTRQQAAVRAAFDLSHQHLTDAQARLFRLLPVNPGPDIATSSAARLADLPDQNTATLLADLHRAHLITEPMPDRWGMHDLVRLYATEHQHPDTESSETGQARQRLYDHYLHTARAADVHLYRTTLADTSTFPDRVHALAWLDAEHANLIATAITAAPHHPDTTCGLGSALARFLDFRRHLDDWITLTTLARDIFQQTGDLHGEGEAWNGLGVALREVRRFDEAIAAHLHGLEICRQTGDLHSEGRALTNLGTALAALRRFDEAIAAHTHARDLFQQTNDLRSEGAAWNGLGNALGDVRRFNEAIAAHTRNMEICRQTGDPHGEGVAWGNLGIPLAEVRRFDEAIAAHTRALDIFQQTGDLHGEGINLTKLGLALAEVRRFDEAIAAHTRARDIFQQTGDVHLEGAAWGNLGLALAAVCRFEEAIDADTRAIDIFQQTSDPHHEGGEWTNLGGALRMVGRFDEAIAAHLRGLEICRQTGDLHREGAACQSLGLALAAVCRFEEAIAVHTRARDIFQQTGDLHREGAAWTNLGLALVAVCRFEEAIAADTRARDIFQQTGDLHREGAAWTNLGLALVAVCRFDEAIIAHTHARDIFQQTGDLNSEGQAWRNLGLALAAMRRLDKARSSYQRAAAAFTAASDPARLDP